MTKMEKPEQFDIEKFRRKVAEARTSGGSPSGTVESGEINALAKQVAGQYTDENYSPTIITGQLRLL